MKKKKNTKKFSLLAIVLLIATVFTSMATIVTEAEVTAPKSFVVTRAKKLPMLIADYAPSEFTTDFGGYVLCNNLHKKDPIGQTMTLVKEASPGITYLLANGYPNKSITGNSEYDSFITRSALWWYMDETTGSNNISDHFKTAADPYNLRSHIINLVNNAKKVTAYETSSFTLVNNHNTMSLTADKKYYESASISATSKNVTGNYTVSLSGAPSGTVTVNAASGVVQTSFAQNESFKVRIPVSSMKDTKANVKIKAVATGAINKAYEYQTSNPNEYQNLYSSTLYADTKTLTSETEVSLLTSKVTIMKVDSKTGKTLAGATLELLDKNGKKITSWVSTTKAHVVKNLPNGTYTLREVSSPTGYKKKVEDITIKINDQNRDVTIKVENEAITKLVSIVKIDKSTDKPLAGANLIVKNKKGEIIADFITTEDPYTITKLEDGTYTVEEVSAPNGYKKTDEVYTFEISDDMPTAQVVVENYPEVTVPNTHSGTSMISMMLGFMIIVSGIGIVRYNGKKQQ